MKSAQQSKKKLISIENPQGARALLRGVCPSFADSIIDEGGVLGFDEVFDLAHEGLMEHVDDPQGRLVDAAMNTWHLDDGDLVGTFMVRFAAGYLLGLAVGQKLREAR